MTTDLDMDIGHDNDMNIWSLLQPWKTADNQIMISVRGSWYGKRTTLMIRNENGSTADGDNHAQIYGGPYFCLH